MKILVTGAAGFIGYHLSEKLVQLGHEVVGIDNINDYYSVQLKYDRLKQLGIVDKNAIDSEELVISQKNANFSFKKLDITNLLSLEELFKYQEIAYVVNLAAQAGVRYSIENPHAYVQSNIVGFMNILECCRNYEIKHLLYASSSSVYGANSKIPFSEDDRVDHPVSLYAATKKSNELMAHTYSHLYQLPTTGLRFFTVYGPWGRPDMAPMLFADAITNNRAIKVFNNGDMERDFTYIDDIVNGIIGALSNKPTKEEKNPYYRVLNIGNSQPIRLMDFISCLESVLGIEAQKKFMPMQKGDVKRTYADTTKLEEVANYSPVTSIEKGVNSFVKWYNNYYKC